MISQRQYHTCYFRHVRLKFQRPRAGGRLSDEDCTTTTTTTTTKQFYTRICLILCAVHSLHIGSIYCRPQRARPSKLIVVGCLCAHECLTSKTFLFNLQSNYGSRSPHHTVPWISGPHCSLTTSSCLTVVDFAHMPSFFVHPSSRCLLNTLTTFENILSSAYGRCG